MLEVLARLLRHQESVTDPRPQDYLNICQDSHRLSASPRSVLNAAVLWEH